jgi:hypothetical protein
LPATDVMAPFVWVGNDDHGEVRTGAPFVQRRMALGEHLDDLVVRTMSCHALVRAFAPPRN